jgi:hypothetical protein
VPRRSRSKKRKRKKQIGEKTLMWSGNKCGSSAAPLSLKKNKKKLNREKNLDVVGQPMRV